MPPHVTPLIQPMDQNVIRITKLFYRKNLLAQVMSKSENIGEALKALTLRDAVFNLHVAWRSVKQNTIEKCWHNLLSSASSIEEEDDIPLSVLKIRIQNEDIECAEIDIANMLHIINPNVSTQLKCTYV